MLTLALFGSGSGSNAAAIMQAIADDQLEAQVAIVISDKPDAGILKHAANHAIPSAVVDFNAKDAQANIAERLLQLGVDLICLAGFMRIVRAPLLDAFAGRIVNIHPSLLPAYPGRDAWKQALADGVKVTGCSIHYVDSGIDTGEVIAQAEVAISPDDSAESLHSRIQQAEWQLYPQVLQQFSSGEIAMAPST